MAILNEKIKGFTTIVAVDISKNSFQVCVARVDGEGKPKQYKYSRAKFHDGVIKLGTEGTLIVMEACASSHHWGRVFQKDGFAVKLIAPQHTKKYLKNARMKNDANDAEAIFTCAIQHNTKFIKVKTNEESAAGMLQTTRQGFSKVRTEISNRMRGCAGEFGIAVAQGDKGIQELLEIIDSEEMLVSYEIPESGKFSLRELSKSYRETTEKLKELNKSIEQTAKESKSAKKLMEIPGIGPIIANAIVTKISNGEEFDNGRQVAAYIGLAPSQNSTGGRNNLGSVSKTGDKHLRALLVQGAQSVVRFAHYNVSNGKDDQLSKFAVRLLDSGKHRNKVVVAVAAKMIRIAWAVLRHDTNYHPVTTAA